MATRYEYMRCVYHSEEWSELIEQGWTTMHVNTDGMALMCRAV